MSRRRKNMKYVGGVCVRERESIQANATECLRTWKLMKTKKVRKC